MYVYVITGSGFDVGFYDPQGVFVQVQSFRELEAAEQLTSYLNGGTRPTADLSRRP